MASHTTPADWYVNPEDPAEWRYWNGEEWTDHVAPRLEGSQEGPVTAQEPIEVESVADSTAEVSTAVATHHSVTPDDSPEGVSPSPRGLAFPAPLDYRQPGGKKVGGGRWSRLARGIGAANELIDVMDYHNKCIYCGKRLKYAEHAVITASGKRMKTCRACGRDQPEQPKMSEVLRSLNQARNIFVEDGPLPLCKECQVSLLVGATGSYVFCRECAYQWSISEISGIRDADDITEDMKQWFPIPRDESPIAVAVQRHLETLGCADWSDALLVVVDEASRNGDVYHRFVSARRDRIEVCDVDGDKIEFDYLDIDPETSSFHSDRIRLSLRDGRIIDVTTEMAEIFLDYLNALRQVNYAASIPFEEEHGSTSNPASDALQALERLASLHREGLLTEEEFNLQKAKMLKRL